MSSLPRWGLAWSKVLPPSFCLFSPTFSAVTHPPALVPAECFPPIKFQAGQLCLKPLSGDHSLQPPTTPGDGNDLAQLLPPPLTHAQPLVLQTSQAHLQLAEPSLAPVPDPASPNMAQSRNTLLRATFSDPLPSSLRTPPHHHGVQKWNFFPRSLQPFAAQSYRKKNSPWTDSLIYGLLQNKGFISIFHAQPGF